ncbi:DUF1206 domain-containing protein [Microbacterium sp. LRZ72]|uniref:DUF1206 domain-containing protein n=1 Tax=Microbacterium sp. LRZ72 TaxID=2942481 RepID=UPI0029A645B1|nr:DUF1206 domain-containing protein [Microbacterium sp. LRZ72]MDX2377387.1 DUF1206 domain-containing protein [Microbacterium sp. LRZ72]
MSSPSPRRGARKAAQSRGFRVLARIGYVALGAVHVLIGGLMLVVAGGGSGETDQNGAMRVIADAPAGFAALWAVAAGLWALAAWKIVEGTLVWARSGAKKWGRRVSRWAQAVAYAAIGGVAASVALGSRSDGDTTTENASSGLLAPPGGVFVLGAIGLGVVGIGVGFVILGAKRSFRSKIAAPAGLVGAAVDVIGTVGYIAKGIALGIVGGLLVTAAVRHDGDAAGGLDEALHTLLGVAFGPWLVAFVGVGFIAYGAFCGFRARYARF